MYAALRDWDACFATLAPADINASSVVHLFYSPVFDPVRSDPRFARLLATIGLTREHDKAQAWRARQKNAEGR